MKKLSVMLLFLTPFLSVKAQPSISIEPFRTGLDRPVNVKHAGDSRLFVVEQDGLIQIVNADGSLNANPFLDIRARVGNITGIGDERGLLGLAFHPNYSSNGFFYVNYIDNSGDTMVSRFSRSSGDPDLADATTELEILPIVQPFSNHNGGDLVFGPDGYLYISSGDGGSGGDPGDRAQSLSTLLGKMLRIDVDNTSNGNNYAIPADNPFVGNTSALDEIWAYGLRNTWKFSFDRQTGDLWTADVGQNNFEEINMVPVSSAGLNYGWRCFEGNQSFNSAGCPSASTLTFPVGVYSHSGTSRCSVTGGYRYRGSMYPGLIGLYIFADYCSNEIGVLEENGASWDLSYSGPFSGNNWAAFGEDVNGELYIAGISSGTLYKIKDASLGVEDFENITFEMYPNPTKDILNIRFSELSLPASIHIYDIQGKRLQTTSINTQNLVTIPTQKFAKGLYLVTVSDSNGSRTNKKLIIH